MLKQSYYLFYDVMNELDEWDDHTQTIVTSRLKSNKSFHFLTAIEAEMVRRISSLLVSVEKPASLRPQSY
ncbi:hypothetical protein GC098_14575 [Paenibacillus sp. LMG 31458]|uniref:Uncharacterized protein n=1 Tax=Paenibacillus phytorum TaxID=2654977 RepID=A0ABX1XXV6_9BACL|nr:hypothetical protein [Paenibacillus phytorum]NOU72638.1 hypothetical protein [Paenibacillus phytorum]